MKTEDFNRIVEAQLDRCRDTLIVKAQEYSTEEDRLHNFKVAAALQGGSPERALAGMMTKHIVSIFDMCNSDRMYGDYIWNEKIGDAINYLLLLRAIVDENYILKGDG